VRHAIATITSWQHMPASALPCPIARPGRIYRMAPMTAVIDDILEACFDDPVADADRRISYFSARVDSIKGYWK
jgi:hypothetical protein